MSGRVTTITRLVFPDQANHHETLFGGEAGRTEPRREVIEGIREAAPRGPL